jgi:pimeloyl-ACP methyl ester carboxylesterase
VEAIDGYDGFDAFVRARATGLLGDAATDQDFLGAVDAALRTVLADLPVLAVFGSKSPTVKGGFPEGWTARFPGASRFIVEGGHHFPMMDDPRAVADVLASWWQAVVAPTTASERSGGSDGS